MFNTSFLEVLVSNALEDCDRAYVEAFEMREEKRKVVLGGQRGAKQIAIEGPDMPAQVLTLLDQMKQESANFKDRDPVANQAHLFFKIKAQRD